MEYHIFIDSYKIGITRFDKADPSMGVVFGKIEFVEEMKGYEYEFFKGYCENNDVLIINDDPSDKIISAGHIEDLVVVDHESNEIPSVGNQISGMGSDFEVSLEGIEYPLYEKLFPKHVKDYKNRFQ